MFKSKEKKVSGLESKTEVVVKAPTQPKVEKPKEEVIPETVAGFGSRDFNRQPKSI